ncbi:hypothetical protein ACPCTO_08990 [Streptomyces olivoreticuli]
MMRAFFAASSVVSVLLTLGMAGSAQADEPTTYTCQDGYEPTNSSEVRGFNCTGDRFPDGAKAFMDMKNRDKTFVCDRVVTVGNPRNLNGEGCSRVA